MSDLALVPDPDPITQPDAVAEFCRSVLSRHGENWPVSEQALADEFLALVNLEFLAGFEEVSRTCQERLQIQVALAPLPDCMKGYNGTYGCKREILVSSNQDFDGAKLHTLLHELREILECEFEKLGHPISDSENSNLEERAETFATAVQVRAANTALPVLLEYVSAIERKWLRFVAYALCASGALAYVLGCCFIPQIEDAFAKRMHR